MSPEAQSFCCHFLQMPVQGCAEGRICCQALAARGCLLGGISVSRPSTHSWWSCWQLEPQPAWPPSPKIQVPRAGRCCLRVTCNTPPCFHLGHWDPWAAAACAYLRATLLQFGVPSIAPFRKITDSSVCSRFGQVLRTSPNFLLSSQFLLLGTEDKLSADDKVSAQADYSFHTSSPPRQLQCLARGSEECACQ